MKFKIVFLTTLLLAVKSYAQPKNEINLPEGGKDIEIKHLTSLYSLYITQNQEVYNDDKRLKYFQDINYSFLNQLNKNISKGIPLVLIYADIKTPFKFIFKAMQHIPGQRWVFYMTENIEGLKATAFRNYGSANSFRLEEILTLEEENSMLIEDFAFAPPMPPPNVWYVDFEETIYSGDSKAIKEVLNKYSHTKITVSNNKTLKYNNLTLNDKSLRALIGKNQVVFLNFDEDVLYEDYIDAIQNIKKHQRKLEEKKENKAYIIEVSFWLEQFLKENAIELN